MKTTVQPSELFHDLKAMDRDNFSYDGAVALMEYLEECGVEDYDPIAFCCEFTEYGDLDDFHTCSGYDATDYPDIESIYNATSVIEFGNSGSFIIVDF